MSRTVSVRVPATSANMGPGFDCFGVALALWNEVSVTSSESFALQVSGEGAGALRQDQRNLVYRAFIRACDEAKRPAPVVVVRCHNSIPVTRGLGSSSAAVVGGLAAANALMDSPISQERLLALAIEMEGHPDNVTPAVLGGFCIVARDGERWVTAKVAVQPGLKAVLFIPDIPMSTARARDVLPRQVERADAIYNIARASLLVEALSHGRWELLRTATQDSLHQPARTALFPAMPDIIAGALESGAAGAFLSGSGSTIVALAAERFDAVAAGMASAAARAGVKGASKVVDFSPSGYSVSITE